MIFKQKQFGFTLIELLLAMGIAGILFSISYILMLNLIPQASFKAQTEVFSSQVRNQQLKSMIGSSFGSANTDPYGVKINAQSYILFHGSSFDPASPANFEIMIDEPIELQTTLSNQELFFRRGSGEVIDFQSGQNTITIFNPNSGGSLVYEINQYGVLSEN